MKFKLTLALTLVALAALAQVDEIKKKSSENSDRKESSESSGSSSGGGNVFAFFDMFRFVGEWQAAKLEKHETNPRIISFEAFAQAAIQPSNYYLTQPRVRGNWGLFSTDFRFNWLVEQNIGGAKELSTFDWQILQLNLITTKSVTGRVGAGNYYENFGSHNSFFESSFALSAYPEPWPIAFNLEYRVANDFSTGAVPRREFNFSLEREVFAFGKWHGNATLGGVYQRYYESISVWGIQLGLAMRVY
jgi:hypothetical protein